MFSFRTIKQIQNSAAAANVKCRLQVQREFITTEAKTGSAKHVFPEVLLAVEQPPVQPPLGVRPAPARREFRRRDVGRRGPTLKGAQNGLVGLQPVFPSALREPPRQAPDRHPERRPVQRHEEPVGFHVQGRSERRPGQTDRLPARRGESANKRSDRSQRGEVRLDCGAEQPGRLEPAEPPEAAAVREAVRERFQHAGERAAAAEAETRPASETVGQLERYTGG